MKKIVIILCAAVVLMAAKVVQIDQIQQTQTVPYIVPQSMTYQGILWESGAPVNGPRNLEFTIGSWTAQKTVTITDGRYVVELGDASNPLTTDMFDNTTNPNLQIKVNGTTLSPDVILHSVPTALVSQLAQNANYLNDKDSSYYLNPQNFHDKEDVLIPAGTIVATGSTTAPNGWLLCDGATVSRTQYARLFNAIGTGFGAGTNSSNFHLPDLRGKFLRGVSGTTNNDPNKNNRTASNTGGNTGNNVGSSQGDATALPNLAFTGTTNPEGDHVHEETRRWYSYANYTVKRGNWSDFTYSTIWGDGIGTLNTSSDGEHSHPFSVSGGGDPETCVKNVYVNYIIKI